MRPSVCERKAATSRRTPKKAPMFLGKCLVTAGPRMPKVGARLLGTAGQRRKQQTQWTPVRRALLPSAQGTVSDWRLAYDQGDSSIDEGECMRRPTKENIMRRLTLALLASFALSISLLMPVSSEAGGEAHPLIRRAVAALQAARTDLQNAAHDYCG